MELVGAAGEFIVCSVFTIFLLIVFTIADLGGGLFPLDLGNVTRSYPPEEGCLLEHAVSDGSQCHRVAGAFWDSNVFRISVIETRYGSVRR